MTPETGFKSYKDYSFKGITIKAFKCPTCQRGRLFTPEGSIDYKEWKKIKKLRKKIQNYFWFFPRSDLSETKRYGMR